MTKTMFISQLNPEAKAEIRYKIYQALSAMNLEPSELNEYYEAACDSRLSDLEDLLGNEVTQ